jgi:hypothetical protein
MAAKPTIPMGKLLPFPERGAKPESRTRLDEVTGAMIAAEHALFAALRLVQKRALSDGQPPIQPPPRTSSSRKKTAA